MSGEGEGHAIPELEASALLSSFASPVHPAGGGSAAALTGAIAAALVAKAARAGGDGGPAAQAVALAVKLDRLAALDSQALSAAREALSLATEGGNARTSFALGERLSHAAAVPLEIAEACGDVADLADHVVESCPDDLRPDVRAAAWLAGGAAQAAAHLVEVNLGVPENDPRAERARGAARRAVRPVL